MGGKCSAWKVLGIVLAALFVLSAAGAAVAALGGRTELVYERKDYAAPAAGITQIRVNARNMPVTLQTREGGDVALTYYTSEKDPYDVTLEGGVLTLTYRNDVVRDILGFFTGLFRAFTNSSPRVELTVPADFSGSLRLGTSNGAVSVSGLLSAGETRLTTSNGPVTAQGVTASLLDARTSNGPVTLTEVIVAGTADVRTSNGHVTATQVAARDRLRLETSNGHVVADRIGSGNIEIVTSNASVTGSVSGKRADYAITSSTSNGVNTLGSGGTGANKLSVRTSNGNIDVRFLSD